MTAIRPSEFAPALLAFFGAAAGGVLVFTGLSKAGSFEAFAGAVTRQGVVPTGWVRDASVAFIALELLVGIVAVRLVVSAKGRRRWGMWLLAAFFGGLTAYSAYLWVHPPVVAGSCGCGLSSRVIEHWAPLARRNGGVSLAFVLGAWVLSARRGVESG